MRDSFDHGVDLLKQGTDRARAAAHVAVGRVEKKTEGARVELKRLGDTTLAEVASGTAGLIRRHPLATVLVAAVAAGLLRSAFSRSA